MPVTSKHNPALGRMTGVKAMARDWVPGRGELWGVNHISPGSGYNWADGIRMSDWNAFTGSNMYRQGLATGLTDLGGVLYGFNKEGRLMSDPAIYHNGQWGYYEDRETKIDYRSEYRVYYDESGKPVLINGGKDFLRTLATFNVEAVFVAFGDQSGGSYSVDNAVNWLNNNAHESWRDAKGQCARYCRNALEAGFGLEKDAFLGKTPVPARQYGPFLEGQGFQSVNTTNYLKGDIAVIQGYPGATSDLNGVPYGHIQMYNGNIWISDFKQLRDFWPGGGYRTNQPSFVIYRWGN